MSVLSDFEDRVSNAVEGVFAGVFRSPVQPAELAKACGKEMDRRRKLGVGKVFVATLYSVLISPADGDQLGGFAPTLAGELETYLIGYARERDYKLATRPRVRFLVDDGLKLGRFEVIGELLSADEIAVELGEGSGSQGDIEDAPRSVRHTDSPVAVPPVAIPPVVAAPPAPVVSEPPVFGVFDHEVHAENAALAPAPATVTIRGMGQEVALEADRYVLGRLKACDICLPDVNASREHAELQREGSGWTLVDLGSTNGTLVNGASIDRVRLREGDLITIGITELVYREARP
ncbi:MAG TPA: DUF3662 and FHA domain-containing protein [Coriobacteriia bacterium]|nr:DUF3662 and FHA domain-containing protein [Coriobacteriia bacterium]